MTNNFKSISRAFFFLIAALFMVTSCDKDDNPVLEDVLIVDTNGHSNFDLTRLRTQLNNLPTEPLSEGELSGLSWMREEEKLARDTYIKMYELWGTQIFQNISASEQTHMDAVSQLLDKYNLTDPTENNGIGEFKNPTLQQLYDDFITEGSKSKVDALKVGAAIEEVDIIDLEVQLEDVVDNQDIKLVFENLQKGSRNHLRAYVRNLTNSGINYQPQYLAQEEYDAIVNGEMGTNN